MYYDGAVAVKEGDTRAIPGTDKQYYMRNDKFILEHYDQQMNSNTESTKADSAMNKIAKNYETRLTLFENTKDSIPGAEPELKEVKTGNIKVNHPFKFDRLNSIKTVMIESLLKSMTFKVIDKKTEKEIGQTFTVNLDEPAPTYKIADNLTVNLRNYAPDFDKIEANGTLATKTPNTVNPAFVFEVDKANQQPEYSLLKIRSSQDISQNNQHAIKFVSATNHTMTYLNVKKDLTLPYLFIGFTIFLLGLATIIYQSS